MIFFFFNSYFSAASVVPRVSRPMHAEGKPFISITSVETDASLCWDWGKKLLPILIVIRRNKANPRRETKIDSCGEKFFFFI